MKPDDGRDDHEAPDLDPRHGYPGLGRRQDIAAGGRGVDAEAGVLQEEPDHRQHQQGPKDGGPTADAEDIAVVPKWGRVGPARRVQACRRERVAVAWWGLDGRNRRGAFRPGHLFLGVTRPDQHQAVQKEGHGQSDDQGRHPEPDGDQAVDQADDGAQDQGEDDG